MKGLDQLARPFDVSLRIGDRALERLCERWLESDQDGSSTPARTVGDLLAAIQPGLTISPAVDALHLAPSATRSFHGRWGGTTPNSPFAAAERLTPVSLEIASSTLAGTLCRRRWRCPSLFVPAVRGDVARTEALFQGFGPESLGVGLMTTQLGAIAGAAVIATAASNPQMTLSAAVVNTYIGGLGNLLASPPFQFFELHRRGLPAQAAAMFYRYLDAHGTMSEASGAAIDQVDVDANPPTAQSLLAWTWLVRRMDAHIGNTLPLDDLVPVVPQSSLGFSQQDWDDVTRELRTLLESSRRVPRVLLAPSGAGEFEVDQGQLPFALLNLVWLTPALLLSPWRLGPAQLSPPSGATILPQLLGIALDGRVRVRSVEAGVRGDYVFTDADILATAIDLALTGQLPDPTSAIGQALRAAAPVIGQVAATAAMPARATARAMLEPPVKRLQLPSGDADELLAAGADMAPSADPAGALANVVSLALSPFFLAAIAELAVDVGLGSSTTLQAARSSVHQRLVEFRSIADKVSVHSSITPHGIIGSQYMAEVRPTLNALIGALATVQATFQAVAAANLDLDIVNAAPGAAVVRATLTGLDGKLRVRLDAKLAPVTDVEALAATTGAPPSIIQLTLVEFRLEVGALGQLDVLAIADALHEAAQTPATLAQTLASFFGDVGDGIEDVFDSVKSVFTDSPAAEPPPPSQSPAPPIPSPSQRVAAALAGAAAQGDGVLRLVLRRFLGLLPVTEIRWRGGLSLGLDAHVAVAAEQPIVVPSVLPSPTATPWPVAADTSFTTLFESLQGGPGAHASTSLGASVRVETLERYELEFDSAQWSPWAALTATPAAWKGAAPCALADPTLRLQSAPPIPIVAVPGEMEPVFLGKQMASGTNGRPSFVFEPWQLVQALEQAVGALASPAASGGQAQLLQAFISAASVDGKHRWADVTVSAMPHQTLAWIADRIVWLRGKVKGGPAMETLPFAIDPLIADLKAFSAAIGSIWKLPVKLSALEQVRRRQLLVPIVAGADAKVQADWLRAEWTQVGWQPGAVAYPVGVAGTAAKPDSPALPHVDFKDPFGGKGPKWGPNG